MVEEDVYSIVLYVPERFKPCEVNTCTKAEILDKGDNIWNIKIMPLETEKFDWEIKFLKN